MNSQPNILLITTDQQRWDTCGGSKPSWMRTPHLDQLGCEGITFQSAYSDCPVCVPARMSIMSGKTALTHGMTSNGASTKLLGRDDTLPGLLRKCGYQTAAIGKMHFGPQRARHGFDEMILPDDYYREMRASGSPLQPMRHGLGQNELYPTLSTVPESMTLTNWTAQRCVDYILERRDPTVPFFLWCSFSKPHPPLDPPEPYYSMYRDRTMPRRASGKWLDASTCPPIFRQTRAQMKQDCISDDVWPDVQSAYFGLITQIDYNIGCVLAALQEAGVGRDTAILFTSDHGELLGDHQAGGKSYAYEGAAHVPMTLVLPRSFSERHSGKMVAAPVNHSDILPTFLRLAGGDVPSFVEGQDLVSIAVGQEQRQYTVIIGGGNVRLAAISDGRWKFHWFPEGGIAQLFDLASDPLEEINLADAAEASTEHARLKAALIEHLSAHESNYLRDGLLSVEPVTEMADAELRAAAGMGLCTERTPHDIRH